MRRHHKRGWLTPFQAGMVGIVLVVLVTYLGFTKSNPFANDFHVKAAFEDAANVKKGSLVRIAGVNVGKVSGVDPLGDRGAVVTMKIGDNGLPLRSDARFKVRPRIFLEGNYFVDIEPGSPSAKTIEDGDTIPATQTDTYVSIGQVLGILQRDTREDFRRLLHELGKGLSGEGGLGYNRSLRYQEVAFRDGSRVTEATRGIREHDLSDYVASAGAVAKALDRDPRQLKSLVTDFASVADALADEQGNLSAAIHELPRTLLVGRRALGSLDDAFPPLRRFVRDYRPAVRSSGPALDAQLPLVRQLRGLVRRDEMGGLAREMKAVVPDLVELNKGGLALQEQARLLSSCNNTVTIPWANDRVPDERIAPTGTVSEEGVKWFPGIAGESRNSDANGQWVRTAANGMNYAYPLNDGRFMLTSLPIVAVQPPKAASPGNPPLRPDVPCETQERPDLRVRPGQPPTAIKIDQDAPGSDARRTRALGDAVTWLRGQLRSEGLTGRLRVSERPLRAADLPKLRRAR